MTLKCKICGAQEEDSLIGHLSEAHSLAALDYLLDNPGEDIVSAKVKEEWDRQQGGVRRSPPPAPEDLTVRMQELAFPLNVGVPAEACLPRPDNYKLPSHGQLAIDVGNALVALYRGRSIYVWGMPGTGKDALFHAWSADTRTPAICRQVIPGSDIESWFFSRSFNEEGTYWEEGDVLVALRDGYLRDDGKRIPYLLLCSDLDRADRSQAEYLRLIMDSIQGRIHGPSGKVYNVLRGTRVVATANTSGGGDSRGRCISANPLDASILDRFARKFQFHFMDWVDEGPIVEKKFPLLKEKASWIFPAMGAVTKALRDAIAQEKLYAEFSHRGLCSILEHAEDLLVCSGRAAPPSLLSHAARAWLDGLPDEDTRTEARRLMDPHVKGGMLRGGV